jgi:hypothetical protein
LVLIERVVEDEATAEEWKIRRGSWLEMRQIWCQEESVEESVHLTLAEATGGLPARRWVGLRRKRRAAEQNQRP